MSYRAAISAHCPQALQPERIQSRVMASRRPLPRSIWRSAIFSDLQAMRSLVIGTTAAGFAVAARSPKTRHTLIGMPRSPVGSDSDMANASGQGILNGPLSSSARACTTAMASEVSAASRDPGSNVSISALAASIWQSIDMAYASRSLRSSKSVYAPTTMPRAIFAAAGTRGCGFELFMARLCAAGRLSVNATPVALTQRPLAGAVNSPVGELVSGFAA